MTLPSGDGFFAWWPPLPPSAEELEARRQAWENVLSLCDADNECVHGRLPLDAGPGCGCWHVYRLKLLRHARVQGEPEGLENF